MKVRFTVELDAFDAELKDFVASTAARALAKAGWNIGSKLAEKDSGLGPALAEMLSKLSTMAGARGAREDYTGNFPGSDCGAPGPADTVEGSMWEPCSNPVEFVVEHPKFGNRGHVQRVCCAKHKDYIVGGAADAHVARIAGPPPPPPTEH